MANSAAATGTGALILYDVTTLHFEVGEQDDGPKGLRKVGPSIVGPTATPVKQTF